MEEGGGKRWGRRDEMEGREAGKGEGEGMGGTVTAASR